MTGREDVVPRMMRDFASSSAEIDGKGILITGGTGSFGRKMAETLLAHHAPRRLVVFSRDEFKQVEMEQRVPVRDHAALRYFIGDVRDRDRLRMAMRDIDIVIHAAALKHVPIAEYNPIECIHTNVLGAENVIQAAIDAGVGEGDRALDRQGGEPGQPLRRIEARGGQAVHRRQCARRHWGNPLLRRALRQCGGLARLGGAAFSPSRRGGCRRSSHHRPAHDALLDHARPGRRLRPLLPADDGRRRDLRAEDSEHARGRSRRCLAPDLPHRVVGIRPGEKLHEVLITEDDSRTTVASHDRYVIEPPFGLASRALTLPDAEPVPEGFRYASDTNEEWLDTEEMRSLIETA